MATVYILHSASINRFYIGSCLDLETRLIQHQSKEFKGSFTSHQKDWELFLAIDNLEYKQARDIERHIKSMKSKTYILNLAKFPEIIDRLRVKYA